MQRSPAAVVLALLVAGCGRGGEGAASKPATVHPLDGSGTPPAAGSSGSTMADSAKPVTVGVTVTASRPGRPPLQRLIVEVAIDNRADTPRWIVLPKQVPFDGEGGVDGLEVRGQGAALLGTFLGNAGVHALRVAPHAKVTIADLEIGWWRSSASAAEVPPLAIQVADDLTVGGEPAKAWFGVEPLVPDGARLDGAAGSAGAHTAEAEVPLVLAGAVTSQATLTLPK